MEKRGCSWIGSWRGNAARQSTMSRVRQNISARQQILRGLRHEDGCGCAVISSNANASQLSTVSGSLKTQCPVLRKMRPPIIINSEVSYYAKM